MGSIAAPNGNGTSGLLRAALEHAIVEEGCKLKDLTVLAPQHDPFRVDTPTGHRDGQWFAEVTAGLLVDGRTAHLRALHYAVVSKEAVKPNGTPLIDSDDGWAEQTLGLVADREYR